MFSAIFLSTDLLVASCYCLVAGLLLWRSILNQPQDGKNRQRAIAVLLSLGGLQLLLRAVGWRPTWGWNQGQDLLNISLALLTVIGTGAYFSDQRRANQTLEVSHGSEKVTTNAITPQAYLSALVQVQRHLLERGNDHHNYDPVLAVLGEVSAASRVYVFENHQDATGKIWLTTTSFRDGCKP
jgi:hypothetical protein